MSTTNSADERFACLDPELGALLPAFLDGELEADQRSRFEAHLRHCARCSEDLLLRQSIGSMIRQGWPSLSHGAEGTADREGRGVLGLLLARRVPVWVPSVLVAVAIVVVAVVALRPPPPARDWLVVSDRAEYFVPLRTRGGGLDDAPRWRVRARQQLEVTLAAVPSSGMPIVLVVGGATGQAAEPGLPFRLVEGFPVLTVVVPDLPAGEYAATVVSGEGRQAVGHFVLVVTDESETR